MPSTIPRRLGAAAGAVAAAVSLAVGELIAGWLFDAPSLVVAVGDWVIDTAPPAVKDWAIAALGTADKPALVIGITVFSLAFGAVLGIISRVDLRVGVGGFLFFGLVGLFAGLRSPLASTIPTAFSVVVAVSAGIASLVWLIRGLQRVSDVPSPDGSWTRRGFLTAVGGLATLAAATAVLGRALAGRVRQAVTSRLDVVLPRPVDGAPAIPADADLGPADPELEELASLVVSNVDFYRIDTALTVPRVDLESWTLKVSGLVDRPYEMTFDELASLPMVERYVTLSCVSNEVGGDLVGNAKWLGVPLSEVLERAGVQAGAEQVVGRSVDDFTVGFPIEAAFDGREALVAIGMNDEPLPFAHGFPARLVVSGLYGYVSATKWLSEIELTTWDGFDAYWVPRGWSKKGPIKLQSRIDVPARNTAYDPGPVTLAGVAWAPNTGVGGVEVQLGADGEWVQAELATSLGKDSWRQWRYVWQSPPTGQHEVRVRA
ncbi:MAG: molybdopterin-dependent oxidoreductase, partial [Acidimicrobiia bacterium]|nr:molybdopterin-dependent oxidoreductase [Acidimicrobiia bacterium]